MPSTRRGGLSWRYIRRRRGAWLVAIAVALGIGLVLAALRGDGGDGGAPLSSSVPTATIAVPAPELSPDPTRLQRAEVLEVIDGDTIDVRIDGAEERVRYYGVDTPERGDRCYREAKRRNEALAGADVLLLPDPSPEGRDRDRFGRLLRYVFDEQGASIDGRLIAEGLALAWREDGAYRARLVAAEEQTRAVGAGCLWQD